jgi:FkbM family methyltransferase
MRCVDGVLILTNLALGAARMLYAAYRHFLRLPYFRGRDRIAEAFRFMLGPNVTTVRNGLKMQLDPVEYAQVEILRTGTSEESTIRLYEQILTTGDTYVDVGAHVGFHALVARSLVGPTGQLIAIDPQPYNCDRILSNAGLNGFTNISVIVAAIGPKCGLVTLNNQMPQDKSKLSLSENWQHDEAQQPFTVAVCRLDSVTEHLPRIRLLKIDVESYEWELLQGAHDTLAKADNVIIELHPESSGVRPSADLLKETGFSLSDVLGKPWEPGQICEGHNVWAKRA